jgi:hypothetical protein
MLWPQEHGAYAQLAFPLASGLAVGGLGAAGAGMAAAAIALFLAAEPAEVLVGARGGRVRDALSGAAARQLAVLGMVAAVAGLAGLTYAPHEARLAALAPAGCAALLGGLLLARRVKTLGGELVAAAAFAALHLPLAAAGGAEGFRLWGPAAAWLAAFIAATFAVHALKARHKGRDAGLVRAAVAVSILVAAAALAVGLAGGAAGMLGWATLVPAAAALCVAVRPVHPRHLKRVGWALVAANLVALFLMARA